MSRRDIVRDPHVRMASNRDCRIAMQIGVDVGRLVKLPMKSINVLDRAHHARHGGGAVLVTDDPHVKRCEDAGLVVVRQTRAARWIRVTLTTLCDRGHDMTDNPIGNRYCKRCGTSFPGDS